MNILKGKNRVRKFLMLGILLCGSIFGTFFSVQAQTKTEPKTVKADEKSNTSKLPVVTETIQVDLPKLKELFPKAGKNRVTLVNFWATWCTPCREEFPDLIKIDAEFREKGLDFFIVSLDDVADMKTEVAAFLGEMKSTMPSYLLKTPDEEAAIAEIAPTWSGGLPFTMLYDADGKVTYFKQGLIKPDILRAEIKKVLAAKKPDAATHGHADAPIQ
jgi:thiol-disulfide isomerase/thioredoxin